MTREEGIKAIIFLEGLAGVTQTEEQAAKGWDALSTADKEATAVAFRKFSEMDRPLAETIARWQRGRWLENRKRRS